MSLDKAIEFSGRLAAPYRKSDHDLAIEYLRGKGFSYNEDELFTLREVVQMLVEFRRLMEDGTARHRDSLEQALAERLNLCTCMPMLNKATLEFIELSRKLREETKDAGQGTT